MTGREYGDCRKCAHFFRVDLEDESRPRRVFEPQGFCELGQCCGEWSLYVSSSVGATCPCYCHGESQERCCELEDRLTCEAEKIADRAIDMRTKEYHAVKNLHQAIAERIGAEGWYEPLIQDRLILQAVKLQMIRSGKYAEDIKDLLKEQRITEKEYKRILAQISESISSLTNAAVREGKE
ncbi:hypothetical protein [Candidatus Methanomethylophilus sp. 1R26]|uniref:hypothetical protein n=1 Tax=Candidatus Methanomethylophilus sp. 1R26 TaxID=1769296 RepID=UPI0012FEE114|nr:hypothetical protein [Candidatus Methanomethylophilus sp. 1R26]